MKNIRFWNEDEMGNESEAKDVIINDDTDVEKLPENHYFDYWVEIED